MGAGLPAISSVTEEAQRPRSKHLRDGRVSIVGNAYVLTTVTARREPRFANFDAARTAIRCLRESDNNGFTKTFAFVLMPDHLHWMISLERGTLADVMRRFKSLTAREINQLHGTSGTDVWQSGFHDRALRTEDDLPAHARYIVANPVRARIVRHVSEYPFWDAIWL